MINKGKVLATWLKIFIIRFSKFVTVVQESKQIVSDVLFLSLGVNQGIRDKFYSRLNAHESKNHFL